MAAGTADNRHRHQSCRLSSASYRLPPAVCHQPSVDILIKLKNPQSLRSWQSQDSQTTVVQVKACLSAFASASPTAEHFNWLGHVGRKASAVVIKSALHGPDRRRPQWNRPNPVLGHWTVISKEIKYTIHTNQLGSGPGQKRFQPKPRENVAPVMAV